MKPFEPADVSGLCPIHVSFESSGIALRIAYIAIQNLQLLLLAAPLLARARCDQQALHRMCKFRCEATREKKQNSQ
jgi:hypothetical protein